MRRGVFAVAGVVVAVGMMSGCGAEILPLVAVRVDDGGAPEVVLRPCGDDLIQGLSLEGAPGGDESGRNLSGWRVTGKRRGADAEFPLFSPPATWHARPAGEQRPVPSYTYELAFGKAEFNYEYTGTVTFRASDLAALGPGQVWADGRAMSLGEFEELAEDSC
ncbi:hypothetical protein [Streptomyces canus]|uniref:hypothetical protein n=1 Tax=Streptomyces canus TaxID=58343 RepID=UPI002E34FA0B|nr:hypothetical protein [Streptomyces canus]